MTDSPDSGSTAGQPFSGPGDPGSTAPGAGTPNPWSRDFPNPSGSPSADPQPGSQPPAGGYGQSSGPYGRPYAEPTPPYGQQPPYAQPPSGDPGLGYGTPAPPPAAFPPAPGYGVSPYPGGYGAAYPDYGVAAPDHPQATAALVTGIIAIAGSPFLGVGGLVGIASIILGAKARREIDSDPARYSGRGKATAGLVLGVVSVVALVGWLLLILLVAIANTSS